MMIEDINVCVVDFKQTKSREAVCQNEDGSYTILINSRMDRASQIKAYDHAMAHIRGRDFYKLDVQAIEKEAHNHE